MGDEMSEARIWIARDADDYPALFRDEPFRGAHGRWNARAPNRRGVPIEGDEVDWFLDSLGLSVPTGECRAFRIVTEEPIAARGALDESEAGS